MVRLQIPKDHGLTKCYNESGEFCSHLFSMYLLDNSSIFCTYATGHEVRNMAHDLLEAMFGNHLHIEASDIEVNQVQDSFNLKVAKHIEKHILTTRLIYLVDVPYITFPNIVNVHTKITT